MYDIDRLLYDADLWEATRESFLRKRIDQAQAEEVNMTCVVERRVITDDILNGEFHWGIPRKVYISKVGTNKKRVVYIFEMQQRVVLGVLYRLLSKYFADSISENCFSYKKGVSTLKAVEHIRSLNKDNQMYGVKLDISAYFNSVSKQRLDEMIAILFRGIEDSAVCKLVKSLYSIDKVYDRGIICEEYMSLIAGTAIASFFANYCLRDLDLYFEEKNLPYARYSDDIVTFASSKEEVDKNLEVMSEMLSRYGLSINPRKYEYFNPSDNIDFLGLTFNENEIDIHKFSFEKVKAKIRKDIKRCRKKIELRIQGEKLLIKQGKSTKTKRDLKIMENHLAEYHINSVLRRFNYRMYKCFIEDRSRYGWGFYAFRFITTDKTLREIDFYLRDRLAYLYTGKNNKANVGKLGRERLERLGYVNTVMMYKLFRTDFDAYCDKVNLIK